jgi:hypothetical protein
MITDIPTSNDMTTTGVNLLNLAWSIGARLITNFKSDDMLTSLEGLADTYWGKSQPELTNGHAVIDQSIETLLKARITEVSPFLLLSRGLPGKASTQAQDSSTYTMRFAAHRCRRHLILSSMISEPAGTSSYTSRAPAVR